MNVYLDLVFFLNFFFDCLLLFTVNIVLKRNVRKRRIIFGGLVGSSSTIFLFFSITSFELFLCKIFLSVAMVLVCFSHSSLKDTAINLLYLYFVSILLGGFLYYLNLEFSYDVVRNLFVSNQFRPNTIFLLFIAPVILYFYIRQSSYRRKRNANLYCIELIEGKKKFQYTGYLDTGNQLYDPYTKRPVHLLYDPTYKLSRKQKTIYVPYQGLGGSGMIPCVFFDKMIINQEREVTKVLVGFSKEPFQIDGVTMILHSDEILEDS
ncbi:MAG: sigma-E processing peptidase SpoIIGA [Bacilli bacterium]|nr:sigma-E processing peptidase SpoIIGA [Bacilli bacterium]